MPSKLRTGIAAFAVAGTTVDLSRVLGQIQMPGLREHIKDLQE
ncbi:MAG: hypothetical protein WCD02_13335 [Terriglobales bacterium]